MGLLRKKITFYHMCEFQRPTARSQLRFGVKNDFKSYGIALKNILVCNKFQTIYSYLYEKGNSLLARAE